MTRSELELAQSILASQPFSRFLGAEITRFSLELTEMRLHVRDEFRQQNGFVHGGVLSYLADNALTFAGATRLAGIVVTSEFKINYLRPATGDAIIARAHAISAGRNQAVTRCELYAAYGDDEKLCAAAQGTITSIREK